MNHKNYFEFFQIHVKKKSVLLFQDAILKSNFQTFSVYFIVTFTILDSTWVYFVIVFFL